MSYEDVYANEALARFVATLEQRQQYRLMETVIAYVYKKGWKDALEHVSKTFAEAAEQVDV